MPQKIKTLTFNTIKNINKHRKKTLQAATGHHAAQQGPVGHQQTELALKT